MEDGKSRVDSDGRNKRDEIFTKAVRAGKRTYFFDVKETRDKENYLTITESKKRYNKDGKFFYEKHKIFLYKEDFENFVDSLEEVLRFINKNNALRDESIAEPIEETNEPDLKEPLELNTESKAYTDIEFEDLEKYSVTENAK